jgi:hypothetical protein
MKNYDIVVCYYTNEQNITLCEIAVDFFKKNSRELKINIVSNSIPDNHNFFHNDIMYHNSNVDFMSDGSHFGETMLKYLNSIKNEFVFFFCDDYFVIDKIKEDDLFEIVNFMRHESISYFGFDDMNPYSTKKEESFYESLNFPDFNGKFIIRNDDHEYLYSVQPCIWNRKSLLNLLKIGVSLHDLDHTKKILKHNNIIALGNRFKSHMTYVNQETYPSIEYYILSYVETVRHGVFMIPENDPYRVDGEMQVKVIREICQNYSKKNDKTFKRLLHNSKKN